MATALEALTQAEQEKIHQPLDRWSDQFALKVAVADYHAAANYRQMQHDWRWRNADELYLGWCQQKYWTGTRQPRSSLGIFLIFEQVEALLPKLVSQIFSDPSWFEAAPYPGTNPAEARAVRDFMLSQAEPMRLRSELRRVAKSALIYGNGIIEGGWLHKEVTRRRPVMVQEPIRQTGRHPITGQPMDFTAGSRRKRQIQEIKEVENRPFFNYVALKDFFIDPNTPSPYVWDARFAIVRGYKTVDELDSLRGQDGFKIPDKLRLLDLAHSKPQGISDQAKAATEAARRGGWNPALDQSLDPAAGRIEVIAYWTPERLVWALNQQDLAYNDVNPYGIIPFWNAHGWDVLDRFYALGIADVLEGEQRLQQGITNARIDELALAIHPQRIKSRGTSVLGGVFTTRPDQVLEAEDATKALQINYPANVTQQAFVEIQASDARAQKRTGVTDLATLGVPTAGGNSANRTATGVSTQASASASRAQYLVENLEMDVITPMLEAWHYMNQMNLDPEQLLKVLGPEGQLVELDPTTIIDANLKFSMHASSRMRSKQAMMQVFPLLAQTLLNPAFLSLLGEQQNKTVNIDELGQILLESFDYKPRAAMFRDLSPQEIEQRNQPSPEEQLKMQSQRERIDSAGENTETKAMADITKQIIASAKDHLGGDDESEESDNE